MVGLRKITGVIHSLDVDPPNDAKKNSIYLQGGMLSVVLRNRLQSSEQGIRGGVLLEIPIHPGGQGINSAARKVLTSSCWT